MSGMIDFRVFIAKWRSLPVSSLFETFSFSWHGYCSAPNTSGQRSSSQKSHCSCTRLPAWRLYLHSKYCSRWIRYTNCSGQVFSSRGQRVTSGCPMSFGNSVELQRESTASRSYKKSVLLWLLGVFFIGLCRYSAWIVSAVVSHCQGCHVHDRSFVPYLNTILHTPRHLTLKYRRLNSLSIDISS
jgi:hypothetical protein